LAPLIGSQKGHPTVKKLLPLITQEKKETTGNWVTSLETCHDMEVVPQMKQVATVMVAIRQVAPI